MSTASTAKPAIVLSKSSPESSAPSPLEIIQESIPTTQTSNRTQFQHFINLSTIGLAFTGLAALTYPATRKHRRLKPFIILSLVVGIDGQLYTHSGHDVIGWVRNVAQAKARRDYNWIQKHDGKENELKRMEDLMEKQAQKEKEKEFWEQEKMRISQARTAEITSRKPETKGLWSLLWDRNIRATSHPGDAAAASASREG